MKVFGSFTSGRNYFYKNNGQINCPFILIRFGDLIRAELNARLVRLCLQDTFIASHFQEGYFMAKRLSDTEKWNNEKFRKLSLKHKCLFFYLWERSNIAGVWEIDLELASFQIGAKITIDDIKEVYKDAVEFRGNKLRVVPLVDFTWGVLKTTNNVQNSVLKQLVEWDSLQENSLDGDGMAIPPISISISSSISNKGVIGGNDPCIIFVDEAIKILNEVVGAKFSSKSQSAIKFLTKRFKEKTTLDEIRAVVTYKNKEWGSDLKMERYLRPETLFGSKFDSYLAIALKSQDEFSQLFMDAPNAN